MLPLKASPDHWARKICALTADQFTYQMLSDACFDRAKTRLTWNAWRTDLLLTLDELRRGKVPQQLRIVAA